MLLLSNLHPLEATGVARASPISAIPYTYAPIAHRAYGSERGADAGTGYEACSLLAGHRPNVYGGYWVRKRVLKSGVTIKYIGAKTLI